MIYLSYIAFLYLSILGFVLFPAVVKTKVPVCSSPLLGISIIVLILYPFSLFGWGHVGIRMVFVINCLLILLSLILLFFHNKSVFLHSHVREDLQSVYIMLFSFSLAFFILGILSRLWNYTGWDEFANWDSVVRSLVRFGEKRVDTNHPNYPPGIALFQYYFIYLTSHRDNIVIFATVVVILAGVVSLFSYLKTQRFHIYIFLGIFPILLLYLFDFKINTTYVDGLIGILFGSILFMIYTKNDDSKTFYLFISLLLSFLISIKDACLGFTSILIFLTFYSPIFQTVFDKNSFNFSYFWDYSVQNVGKLFLLFSGPCITYGTWELRNFILNVRRSHDFDNITWNNILTLFSPNVAQRESGIYQKITSWLFSGDFGNTGISLYSFILILLLIVIIYYYFSHNLKFLFFNVILGLGFFFYLVLVSLIYLFAMDESNALSINSYDRFLMTYLIAWVMLVFSAILWTIGEVNQSSSTTISVVLSIIIIFTVLLKIPMGQILSLPIRPNNDWTLSNRFYSEFSNFIPDGSVIKTIHQGSRGLESSMLKNLFIGKATIIGAPYGLGEKNEKVKFDYMIKPFSFEEFSDYLETQLVDYIIVGKSDDYFWTNYGALFDEYSTDPDVIQLFERESKGKFIKVYR